MAKPASRKSGRAGGGSIFTGVLIGLIVGAILAVGVALWATGFNPFKSGKQASAPTKPVTPAPATPATPDTAPSFDFYKVLPDNTSGALPPAAAPAPPAPLLYLQAGAFQRADEADNLKAQLALLGVEAVIQTSEVANKGVLHRVRIGPFHTADEANRTRSLLAQNNIPVTLVKEVPTQQETP
ncbi:MAG: cell division protein FtsN [Thiobacillus sp. 63-78]|uniref:SPOR domain-containing protein n=1 Tax=Thiobacillus sp. 63-78 TaxID=1895859 RepID=UPI00096A0B92|nr:SPOR domain-containing protein [Thiobacillus sp. 63-78]MBN8773880.1 SPOR domain-containing protein [Thiobacillus sp.]OJZ15521.1 MAG: cell division protein FtsN [Thiobacillus sp. 63-78]